MSSTKQTKLIGEMESYDPVDASFAEAGVAGSQPRVADPAKLVTGAVHISTLFTSSILNRVGDTEETPALKKSITEADAASILVSMKMKYATETPQIRMGGPSSRQTARSSRVSSGPEPCATLKKSKKSATIPGKEKVSAKQLRSVSRRASSTGAVFVPKTKVGTKAKKTTKGSSNKYNTFRTKASKVLGAQVVKQCRKGTSFNGIIAVMWREVPDVDKAAFGDWTGAKWKDYLTKLVTGGQLEHEEVETVVRKKEIKVATRIQPRRKVEGKTKK